jgi:hypothetical protein
VLLFCVHCRRVLCCATAACLSCGAAIMPLLYGCGRIPPADVQLLFHTLSARLLLPVTSWYGVSVRCQRVLRLLSGA